VVVVLKNALKFEGKDVVFLVFLVFSCFFHGSLLGKWEKWGDACRIRAS